MRLLARDLNISVSFLSRVLAGKKAIPYALLLKIQKPLEIESEVFENIRRSHTEFLEGLAVPVRGKVQVKTEMEDWELAEKKTLNVLRHWYYLPILEFSTLKRYDGTPASVAKYLGLSTPVVEVALRELVSVGLMKEQEGRFIKTKKKIRWGSSKSVSEIRRFHDQMMSRAQEVLRTRTSADDFEKRLISGITLTTSPKKIKEAKRKLNEILHELANDLIAEDGTEVYHLALQFFPLGSDVQED